MANQMTSRRELLLRIFPACSLCLGIPRFGLSSTVAQAAQPLSFEKRTAEKTDMSYVELFSFAYEGMIPVFQNLCNQVGKEKFLEMLKKATYESAFRGTEAAMKQESGLGRDMATLTSFMKKPSTLYQHALTYRILKDTEEEAEYSITECLWAKTFRQMNAEDIGYALVCHGDVGSIEAFNPKITFKRPSLLMQGDSECLFQYKLRTP